MKIMIILAGLLATGAPAALLAQTATSAQTAPVSPTEAARPAPLAPVDPARLAAARPVIDRIWPLGTYARLMRRTMDQVMQSSLAGMYGMRLDQIRPVPGGTGPQKVDAPKVQTLGEALRATDPHSDERRRITMRVMGDEMARIMTDVEPEVREAMAHAYARRFTVAQLSDLDRFFATPTGAIYASESMTLMSGPDMSVAMQSFMPRIMRELPTIMAKVKEATKDLPPPVKKVEKQ